MTIREALAEVKIRQIKWALERTNGNIRKAAPMIGCNPITFGRWMREFSPPKSLERADKFKGENLQKFAEQQRRKRFWEVKPRNANGC
jgi:hypothetical protein